MTLRLAVLVCVLLSITACSRRRANGIGVVPDSGTSSDMGTSTGDTGTVVDLGIDTGPVTFDAGGATENTPTTCGDFVDNDGDGYTDCNDFNCCELVACAVGTSCNPADAGSDMTVITFDFGMVTPENTVSTCSDSRDNDGDTFIDCNDFNCCAIVTCALGTSCNPSVDGGPASPENTVSACTDFVDNDGDGYTDCDDFNCCDVVFCASETSCGMRDAGVGPPATVLGDTCGDSAPTIHTTGSVASGRIDDYTVGRSACSSSGADAFFIFAPSVSGTYVIDTGGSEFDTVLAISSGTCSASFIDCDDDGGPSGATSSLTFTATAGTNYYVFVSAYSSVASGMFYVGIVSI